MRQQINPAKVSLSLRLPLLSFFSTAVSWYLIDVSMEPFFQRSWFHAPRQWRIFAREGSKLLFVCKEGQAKRQNICLSIGKIWSDLCSFLKSFFHHLISKSVSFQFAFISTAPMLLVFALRRLAKALLALAQTWIRPRKHLLLCILSYSWTATYIYIYVYIYIYIGWYCCGLSFCRTLFWLGIPSRFMSATWFAFVSVSSARTAIANSAPWIVLCPTGHLGPLVHHFARAQQRGQSSQTELMTQNHYFRFWILTTFGCFKLLYIALLSATLTPFTSEFAPLGCSVTIWAKLRRWPSLAKAGELCRQRFRAARNRTVLQEPQNGGLPCGKVSQSKSCSNECVDCALENFAHQQ